MSINKNIPANRYINGMSNILYLTGFARNPDTDAGVFYLQQNNNMDQLIPVRVRPNMRMPGDRTPVTVLAHVYGTKDDEGNPSMDIRAFDIQKPSVRAMPTLTAWIAGSKKETDSERFNPFTTTKRNSEGIRDGELTDEVKNQISQEDKFSDDEQVLRDILEATRGRLDTRLGDNANVVKLAGFVDSMKWIEPNEFQENGHVAIMLRQHDDQDRNIPIRLHSQAARVIMKGISIGLPISIVGQVRMKTIPDDKNPGKKISRLHVRVNDIYSIEKDKDIKEIPAWWQAMRDQLVEQFRAKREKSAAKQKVDAQGENEVLADL